MNRRRVIQTLGAGAPMLLLPRAHAGLISISGSRGSPQAGGSASWASRIAGPGVVWYHSFDTAAEVNKFRWGGGYGSGNDPLALASNSSMITWLASGGADGGPYMQLRRPPGVVSDLYYWARPMSPLDSASTGRGAADPAASGTLPLQAFTPTDGGSQTADWDQKSRPGWYGKPGYEAAGNYGNATYPQFASIFDGDEFYFQIRVKAYPERMTIGNPPSGKFINFCVTHNSHPNQEINTTSGWNADSGSGTPDSPIGGPYQPNVHAMYEGAFQGLFGWGSNAIGSPMNYNSPRWAYSGGWDTLLYRIRPGSQNPSDPPFTYDTFIEVWAAHAGETTYTKIWDIAARTIFDDTEQFNRYVKYAWNAVLCWIYHNGLNAATEIIQGYDQLIFSKATIACPS